MNYLDDLNFVVHHIVTKKGTTEIEKMKLVTCDLLAEDRPNTPQISVKDGNTKG